MIIRLDSVTYYYPEGAKPGLDQVSVSVEQGEFVLITGPSGGGKTTLGKVIAGLIPDYYGGRFGGEVEFFGKAGATVSQAYLRQRIGFVYQDPESQVLMSGVERELAVGLENLGLAVPVMRRRIAEVAGFLSLQELLKRKTSELSSGELQKVVLGSVLAMMPSLLVLDEPTSQLSPRAAAEFFSILKELNREHGIAIVLIEQRIDECFWDADKVLFVEGGCVQTYSSPDDYLEHADRGKQNFVPELSRLFSGRTNGTVIKNVKDGRKVLGELIGSSDLETNYPRLEKKWLPS